MRTSQFLTILILVSSFYGFSQTHKEDWVTYVVKKEKGPMTVSSNLYYNFMGKPNYKNLLVIGTNTKNCLKNGYPDYLGLAKFYSFSDSIATRLNRLTKSRLVGVLTYQCAGFDVYYVKDTVGVRKNLQKFLDYNHALSKNYLLIENDKKWSYYKKNLIPGDLSDNFFVNHEYLNQLVAEGDDLSEPRKLSHWINFRRSKSKDRFLQKIKPLGYTLDSSKVIKDYYPYQVQISRKDSITPGAINKITITLSKFSLLFNGIYDGWGTEALKEEEENKNKTREN